MFDIFKNLNHIKNYENQPVKYFDQAGNEVPCQQAVTMCVYDMRGNCIFSRSTDGSQEWSVYDDNNNRIEHGKVIGLGYIREFYTYDENNNRISGRDDLGNSWTY